MLLNIDNNDAPSTVKSIQARYQVCQLQRRATVHGSQPGFITDGSPLDKYQTRSSILNPVRELKSLDETVSNGQAIRKSVLNGTTNQTNRFKMKSEDLPKGNSLKNGEVEYYIDDSDEDMTHTSRSATTSTTCTSQIQKHEHT